MNKQAGKPVFEGAVDQALREKITEHAQAGASTAGSAASYQQATAPMPDVDAPFSETESLAHETEPSKKNGPCCCGEMFSKPWHFIVCGVMCLALLVLVGRFMHRLFSTRDRS